MTRRQKAIAFFVALCVLLVGAAVSLNIGWILINARRVTPLLVGIVLFALIIAGLIIYTVFLVLEIKRNEEHTDLHQCGHARIEDADRVDSALPSDPAVKRH